MSVLRCRHAPAVGLMDPPGGGMPVMIRCRTHSESAAGVSVWVWGPGGTSRQECPCAAGDDRFLVVTEGAPARWTQSADVVTALPRPTAPRALRAAAAQLARAPGCALVTVGVHGSATLFVTRTERVLVPHGSGPVRLCGACVYPWLAAGYRLAHLVELLGPGVRAGSRG